MEAPCRQGNDRPQVEEETKLAVRVCALAQIKHALGDAFSIEHAWPTPMMRMMCCQELLDQPGVFALVFDNCCYGETYRHRQGAVQGALSVLRVTGGIGQRCNGTSGRESLSCWF